MNKVEFDHSMNLVVNGEKLDLEQVFCAYMRRTSQIPGIGPGSPKHYLHSLETLADMFDQMSEFLRDEEPKHRYNGGQR